MHAPMKDLVLSSVVAYVKCIDYLIGKVSKRVAMLSRMRKNQEPIKWSLHLH